MAVRIVKGTVENLLLTVSEVDSGDRVNLTGLGIEFFLTPDVVNEDTPVLTKSETDFVLRDQGVAATKGQADLELSAADTTPLPVGTLIATAFVTASGKRRRGLYTHVSVE